MPEIVWEIWPHALWLLTLLVTLAASFHAVLYKRDAHSAVLWVVLVWILPVLGAVLYLLLGINRIERKAKALKAEQASHHAPLKIPSPVDASARGAASLAEQYIPFSRLVGEVVQRPLLSGNLVKILVNGDRAFDAMLKAIDAAERSVSLSTYIFDNDRAGEMFIDALARAVRRGVEVRVLIDAMGTRYSWPPITRVLRGAGIPKALFLPTYIPWRMPFINLRNHRKIMVVDGREGFTGGMNIREAHMLDLGPRYPTEDLQFRVEGPVVAHLQEVFAADWFFTTGERLEDERWFPRLEPGGPVLARGIADGPDEDFEKLLWTVHGALACAKSSVKIVTPYFIPDPPLITALNLTAMRGVAVDIILPSRNNLPMVKWASTHILLQLMERGCRVWLTRPAFDHSKLMLVDGLWTMVGSANWDSRSFLLNFEFNLECYDRELATRLDGVVDEKLEGATLLSEKDLKGRMLPVKIRDGMAWLFSPYL
jgi:cardiolipin synthase